jgi:flagellar basal-body rod modification protein FlgD
MGDTRAISGFGQLGDTPQSQATQGSSALGKDAFMKLLMAQLANQNPLEPQDNTAYVAQLATFSQVEALDGMSKRMEQLLLAQAASNQTQSASLIGRDVKFRTDQVQLGTEPTVQLQASIKSPAANVTWQVLDENGKVVRTIRETDKPAGDLTYAWDGMGDDGKRQPPGRYTVRVTADDGNGKKVETLAQATGHVDGVTFENGYAELIVGDRKVPMSAVISLVEAGGGASSGTSSAASSGTSSGAAPASRTADAATLLAEIQSLLGTTREAQGLPVRP